MPLENLKILRDDMRDKEKAVIVFRFSYNQVKCYVAVCFGEALFYESRQYQ